MESAVEVQKPQITFKQISYREWCARKWNRTPRELKAYMKDECGNRTLQKYTVWVRNVLDKSDGLILHEFENFNKQRLEVRRAAVAAEIILRRDKMSGTFEIGIGARFS